MVLIDQWLQIKSKDLQGFSFKYSIDEKHLFFVTDLKCVYSTAVRKGILSSTCAGLEGCDDSILETIFDKIADPNAKASFKSPSSGQFILEISSRIRGSVEIITFRLEHFNNLGVEGIHYHLVAPLIHMQAVAAAREERLMEMIAEKDLAIAEFKASGASILASINTKPFNEEQLQSTRVPNITLNEALEQSGPLYSKSLKRQFVKLENSTVNSEPEGDTRRTRKRYDEAAAQKQEQIMTSVAESSSKVLPKRKQRVRI
ncbi:uncharacterized protein LOC132200901 [Neocloeon triangulifer]|uniref:uncharacterized protein LOC132200901 n=1 Tax=Neocloeon triangulifer TaxID=2078957 RepID=UPI00286EEFEF|nr:uncharacterized protein LOC132200901 [Neocloeon triangulifer]